MSEPICRHQQFEYSEECPFVIYTLYEARADSKDYLPHWHEELELVCSVGGSAYHYVDGIRYESGPGRVLAINSGCVHSIQIISEPAAENEIMAIIILVNLDFVKRYIPDYETIIFSNEKEKAGQELFDLILRLSEFDKHKNMNSCDHLYEIGLLMHILFYLYKEGVVDKKSVVRINSQKNIERLRGVIQYVENHYSEHILQSETAEKFYFNSDYFARFFKQAMGMTFREFLTEFRLNKAVSDLLNTDYSVMDIAVKNGFADGRAFAAAFKKRYHQLPLAYRKIYSKNA